MEDFGTLLSNPLLLICSLQHEKYFRGIYLKDIRTKLKKNKIIGKRERERKRDRDRDRDRQRIKEIYRDREGGERER
jgi:hypothetical protein